MSHSIRLLYQSISFQSPPVALFRHADPLQNTRELHCQPFSVIQANCTILVDFSVSTSHKHPHLCHCSAMQAHCFVRIDCSLSTSLYSLQLCPCPVMQTHYIILVDCYLSHSDYRLHLCHCHVIWPIAQFWCISHSELLITVPTNVTVPACRPLAQF